MLELSLPGTYPERSRRKVYYSSIRLQGAEAKAAKAAGEEGRGEGNRRGRIR